MKTLWQRRKMWLIAGAVVLALALAALLLPRLMTPPAAESAGLRPTVAGQAPAPNDTTTAESRALVTVGDLTSEASAGGVLVARRAAALAPATGGTVAETPVEVGDVVSAGDALLRLETAELERAVAQAQQALLAQEAALATLAAAATPVQLAAADAAVHSAQAQLDDLLDGAGEQEIAAAEADARAAQADLAAAAARLQDASAPPDANALRAAQLELEAAQAAATTAAQQHSTILVTEPNQFLDAETLAQLEVQVRAAAQQANADLAAAQQAYDDLVNGDPSSLAARQAAVASAAAQADAAQAQLDLLRAGPSAADLAAARSSLAQAELQRERLASGPNEADRTRSEVAVEQARLRWQRAEHALAEATLTAPFDGVVTAVHVQPGETAAGVAVELVDLATLEVRLEVDEVDIAQVAVGQEALVTLETWPNAAIPATVTAVVPQPVGGSDLVVYEVFLSLGASELPLRAGMTADATLTVGAVSDALLLPSAAIAIDRTAGTYSVQRIARGVDGAEEIVATAVTVGRRSGGFTEITSGLESGDEVIIASSIPLEGIPQPGDERQRTP